MRTKYFGSVTFFKHLIIAVIAALFILPLIIVIIYSGKYTAMNNQLKKTENTVNALSSTLPEEMTETMQQKIDESIEAQKLGIKKEMMSYVSDQVKELQQQLDATISDQIGTMSKSTASQLDGFQKDLNSSIDEKLSDLQQQIDSYTGTQLKTLQVNLNASIESNSADMQKQIDTYLNNELDELKKELNASIDGQTDAGRQQNSGNTGAQSSGGVG